MRWRLRLAALQFDLQLRHRLLEQSLAVPAAADEDAPLAPLAGSTEAYAKQARMYIYDNTERHWKDILML